MRHKLYHYSHKLLHMCLSRCMRMWYRFKSEPGAYHGALSPSFSFSGNVVIDVWDSDLMHLGDQLFFLVLVQTLKKEGIKVWVSGKTGLADLWAGLGVNLCTDLTDYRALSGAIILSKFDMLWQVSRRCSKDSYCIGYLFDALDGDEKISYLLQDHVCRVLNDDLGIRFSYEASSLDTPETLFKQFSCPILLPDLKKELVGYSEWALVSDEVASHAWSAKQRLPLFKEELIRFKDAGYGIIYVGIKQGASLLTPYIDVDLRGKTSVMDICSLLNEESVSTVLSFDTFIAHIGYCFQKSVTVIKKSTSYSSVKIHRYIPIFNETKKCVKKIL